MNLDDLYYTDETSYTGLRWKVDRYSGRRNTRQVAWRDTPAGTKDCNGYYAVSFNKINVRCHIVIFKLLNIEVPDGYEIDHEDRNRLNNSIANLRIVSKAVNRRNKSKYSSNKSGTTGVFRYSNTSSGKVYEYYVTQWSDPDSHKRKVKRFSISKLGDAEAYKLACEHRQHVVERANGEGAGYTEKHGK